MATSIASFVSLTLAIAATRRVFKALNKIFKKMFNSNSCDEILVMLRAQTERFKQMWGPSEHELYYLKQNSSPACLKERKGRAKTYAALARNENNNNNKGLLTRQNHQINAICGVSDNKYKKGEVKVSPDAAVSEHHSFELAYDTYKVKGGNGPQWNEYRRHEFKADDSDVKMTVPSPPYPYKEPNRFKVTADFFRLCARLAAADFSTKNEDIDDLCDMFGNMKI